MNNALLKKAIVNMIGIVGVATLSNSLLAASFDCAKAARAIEKMICSDPVVSQMDSDLGAAYKTAMNKAADKTALKKEQRLWLKTKLNTCKDTNCLLSAYSQRIAQLSSVQASLPIVSSVSQKPKFTLEKGKQFQLCRDFLDLMNRVPKKEDPNCGLDYPFDDVAKKQGFKEINWEEVDLKEYIDIFKNHYVYDKKDMTEDDVKKNEELFDKNIPNSKVRLWKANFDANGDKNIDTVFKVMYKNCIAESGMVFLVRNDGVLDKKAYARKFKNEFFLYQGSAYFNYARFIGEWVGQDTYGYHKGLCQFGKL